MPQHAEPRPSPPKPQSLSRQADFKRVYGAGRRYRTALLTAVVLAGPEGGEGFRTAYVVSRKVARQAVRRNRLKRRLREAFRALQPVEARRLDIVFIAHRGAADAGYWPLRAAVGETLRRAGVLDRLPASPAGASAVQQER